MPGREQQSNRYLSRRLWWSCSGQCEQCNIPSSDWTEFLQYFSIRKLWILRTGSRLQYPSCSPRRMDPRHDSQQHTVVFKLDYSRHIRLLAAPAIQSVFVLGRTQPDPMRRQSVAVRRHGQVYSDDSSVQPALRLRRRLGRRLDILQRRVRLRPERTRRARAVGESAGHPGRAGRPSLAVPRISPPKRDRQQYIRNSRNSQHRSSRRPQWVIPSSLW